MTRPLLALRPALALLLAAAPVSAQAGPEAACVKAKRCGVTPDQLPPPEPRARAAADPADDEAEVRATLDRLHAGFRTLDAALVASAFHPDARILTVVQSRGDHRLDVATVADYLEALADSPVGYDVDVQGTTLRVDGDVAAVWASYRLSAGGQPLHCSTDAYTFVHDAAGWRILAQLTEAPGACD